MPLLTPSPSLDLTQAAPASGRDLSQRIVDSLPGVFYLFDEHGHFLRWNENFARVTGYSSEEIAQMQPIDFFRGEERALVASRIVQAFAEGSADVEADFYGKDGVGIPYYFTGQYIEIDGKPCLIGMGMDVSARRRVEEERDQLFRLSRDMFCIATFDGHFRQLNPAWEFTLGHELSVLIGRPFADFIHPDDRANTARVIEEMKGGSPVYTFENRYLAADGSWHWLSWNSYPVPDHGLIYAVARDITRQKRLEEQLRQTQKLESIGRLAAGIAHDFNNLITVQQAFLSLVQDDARLPEGLASHLRQVSIATDRAAALTRQLLAFSRRQVLQVRTVPLGDVVTHLGAMLRRILGEDVTLDLGVEETPVLVRADIGMLEQVIMNLAVNARDAMPQGGRLSISVDSHPVSASEESSGRSGNFARLTVQDSGVGIPRALHSRIFEPFFTTKEVGKGNGLGLATVYGIVQQHEGWIELDSAPGSGTTFRVFLPKASRDSITPQRPEVPPTRAKGRETILFVEDEEQLRGVIVSVLTERGYDVLVAENGPAAIAVWERHRDEISLLLTDMVMPGGMSGKEVAARLREDRPDLRVILSSGYSSEPIDDAKLPAHTAFLQKPYLPRNLHALVREMLDSSTLDEV